MRYFHLFRYNLFTFSHSRRKYEWWKLVRNNIVTQKKTVNIRKCCNARRVSIPVSKEKYAIMKISWGLKYLLCSISLLKNIKEGYMFYIKLCCSLVKIETIGKCFWHKTTFKTSKAFFQKAFGVHVPIFSCFLKLLFLMSLNRFNIPKQFI